MSEPINPEAWWFRELAEAMLSPQNGGHQYWGSDPSGYCPCDGCWGDDDD